MNYAAINNFDIADGEGIRVALFVTGCPIRCKGCHNPQLWDCNSGSLVDESVINKLIELTKKPFIDGISILGGEPFSPNNDHDTIALVDIIHEQCPNKTIWVYTGYTWEYLMEDYPAEYFKNIDVLVDGPYEEALRDTTLAFRGSRNQRIIDVKSTIINKSIKTLDYDNKIR